MNGWWTKDKKSDEPRDGEISSVVFFAPCTNILIYLLTYLLITEVNLAMSFFCNFIGRSKRITNS